MSYSRMAVITFLDGGPSVGNELPGGAPGYPSHGLPWGPGHPGHDLPWAPAYPGHGLPGLPPGAVTLPVFPFDPTRPDNSLPGSGGRPDNSLPGSGGRPDNSLPGLRPIVPGAKFVVRWLACQGLILVPDNELPETPEPK